MAKRSTIMNTHNSEDCYFHPKQEIATINQNAARQLNKALPRSMRHDTQQPSLLTEVKAPAIDMYNPEVRKLVEQQVMQRFNDLQKTIKTADMLREKKSDDKNE